MAVSLGSTGMTLRGAAEVRGSERHTAMQLDRQRAMDLLRPFQADLRMIRELRTLLATTPGNPQVTDREVLAEIARKIEAKEVFAFRSELVQTFTGGSAAPTEAEPEPAPAAPSQKSTPAAPPPEAATLPPNTNESAQAAAAQQAAQSGAPFCDH